MSSGKSKTQTTTQTNAPPAYAAKELEFATQEARRLYETGLPAYYQGPTFAGFTPQQEQALTMTENRAMRGSPLVDTAQNQLQRTLSGEFLGANEYIDPMIDAANRNITRQFGETVMPSVQASLGRSGRFGNNAATQQLYTNAQRTLAQQLADTEVGIRGNAYAGERQLMNAAIGQAPAMAAQDYADANRLGAVGEQRQSMEQMGIDADMAKYQYESMIDQNELDQFLARLQGVVPMTGTVGTTVAPRQGSSMFSQLLGAGISLGGAALGGPIGGMIGSSLASSMAPTVGYSAGGMMPTGYKIG